MNKHHSIISFRFRKLLNTLLVLTSIAVFAGIMAVGSIALSDPKSKQEQIYQQRQSANILPLEEILELLRPGFNGEIIETEFEYEDGIPVYEFKYISKRGRVREMYVDARTGEIIEDKLD